MKKIIIFMFVFMLMIVGVSAPQSHPFDQVIPVAGTGFDFRNSNAINILGLSANTITTVGSLSVGLSATITQNLTVNNRITIKGGNPGPGKVLTSDANGLAYWAEIGEGGSSGQSCDNDEECLKATCISKSGLGESALSILKGGQTCNQETRRCVDSGIMAVCSYGCQVNPYGADYCKTPISCGGNCTDSSTYVNYYLAGACTSDIYNSVSCADGYVCTTAVGCVPLGLAQHYEMCGSQCYND